MNRRLSYKISIIQAGLSILLVFGHTINLSIEGLRHARGLGTALWYIFYSINVLCGMAVPFFFTISGYLFFWKYKEKYKPSDYYRQVKSRIHTILIPYFIWSILAVTVSLVVGIPFEGYNIFYRILLAVDNGPLWYLRNLLVYIIVSPVIYILMKRRWGGILLFLLLSVLNVAFINVLTYNSIVYCMIYYCIGAFFALKKQEIVLKKYRKLTGMFFFGLAIVDFFIAVKTEILTNNLGRFVVNFFWVISLFIVLDSCIYTIKQSNKKNFFILYCGHMILINVYKTVVPVSNEMGSISIVLINYIVFPCANIVFWMMLSHILERSLPHVYKTIGGR